MSVPMSVPMSPLIGEDCLIRCTDSAVEPIMAQVPSGSGKIPHEGTAADRTVCRNNPMYNRRPC